ncbi:MAG: sugar nucleotide-binding protein [Burkholderiaceae bacterium]|nr:sugar nucleotide-binding protein [Burkholderiaceae bacterium]
MKLLVTGLKGTLAPKLAHAAHQQGVEVLAWDRHQIDPSDSVAAQAWLAEQRPDAIAHLAMGPSDWAAVLAAYAAQQQLPMLFTSTAMVFDHQPDGPHRPQDTRTAKDDYGRYKIACEDAIAAANPSATIARIGWQIDATAPGNNMVMALDDWQRREGKVAASSAWRPACSFMEDTAAALLALLLAPVAGVVHLDSNADEGHSFDALVRALREHLGRSEWQVSVHADYRHDQRLVGGEGRVPGLSTRLPALA